MRNIFNIKSNYNFLQSLSRFVIDKYGHDSILLSKVTILLPSRRACRLIKEIFLNQSSNKAIILPNIKAIGDVDYDEIGLDFLDLYDADSFLKIIANPTSKVKYRCLLIEEIKKFNQKTHLFGSKITSNQIDVIAANLELFLEEIEREELDLDNLENVDESDLAGHKQKILQFLRHFGSKWRNILITNNIKSAMSYQIDMINLTNIVLEKKKSAFPIIIAGSTGSVKATSRLIKTISKLDNGLVVFYGLDKNFDHQDFENLLPNHPQFLLQKLLKFLETKPDSVQDILFDDLKLSDDQIVKLASYAFLEANKTNIWTKIKDLDHKAVANLSLIECKNHFDESWIISLIMLDYLRNQNTTIALVTTNSDLALMVKEILLNFGINIDNSSNNNLIESELVSYLLLIAIFARSEFKVSNLLTILKHPITRAGFDDKFYLENLKLFELEILRKNFSLRNFDIITSKIADFADYNLISWFGRIREIFADFINISKKNFLTQIFANIECARKLSTNFKEQIICNSLTGVSEFNDFLEDLQFNAPNFEVESDCYHKILAQFLSRYKFEIKENHHPRLHILSPIEARIMNFDVMIISNLNEGEFIAQIPTLNWMSRKMRIDFGLSDTAQKIGVSAFDLSNYMANKKVFLTRSLTKNNAPTAKSRFLIKIQTLIQASNINYEINVSDRWNKILGDLFGANSVSKVSRSYPNLSQRGLIKKVSVTDLSKWINDPYYIYAKRILNLKALNPIDQEASFASFGNFVHEILENFVKNYDNISQSQRLNFLLEDCGKKIFQKYFSLVENHILWWPRYENIAIWFVKNEEEIRKELKEILVEKSCKIDIDGVEITTKIDRINFDINGNVSIIDYKSGYVPTLSSVKLGLEPQLPVEALIFLQNNGLNFEQISALQYYSLKGRNRNKIDNLSNILDLIKSANEGIRRLIAIFNNSNTPFYPAPNLDLYNENEFCHLARINEDA